MNITFRQLRTFLALADTGSVSAAAARMHVTQPTVSMQLREITQAVGLPLYEVVSRKVHLTDAGHRLVRTARDICNDWESFEQEIASSKGLTQGQLKVAVVSTAKSFIPRMLGRFCKEHPHIDVSLEVLNRDGVVQRLRDNRDDLYVMSMPPEDLDLEDVSFMPNPLVLIAPPGHPLADRKPHPLKALKNERFILREPGSGTRMRVDLHFRKKGFVPTRLFELGSNEAVREAVASGLGVGIISGHALKGLSSSGKVHQLDIQGFPLESSWHIIYPKGKKLSPIAESFKHHLMHAP
jgi:DNA-binding transcriptional LysR family regulator